MKRIKFADIFAYKNLNDIEKSNKSLNEQSPENVKISDSKILIEKVDFKNTKIKKSIFTDESLSKEIDIAEPFFNRDIVFKNCKFNGMLEFNEFLGFNFKFYECDFTAIIFRDIYKTAMNSIDNKEIKYHKYNVEFLRSNINSLVIDRCILPQKNQTTF